MRTGATPRALKRSGRAVDRIRAVGALLIVTYRPDFKPPWIGQSYVDHRAYPSDANKPMPKSEFEEHFAELLLLGGHLTRARGSSDDGHWACNGFTASTVPATGLRAVGLRSAYSPTSTTLCRLSPGRVSVLQSPCASPHRPSDQSRAGFHKARCVPSHRRPA